MATTANQQANSNFLFLSTPPSRVATLDDGYFNIAKKSFYPRHPRGWRPYSNAAIQDFISFYPRHPRGWRLPECVYRCGCPYVSIHATLAGGDRCNNRRKKWKQKFLSTPPSRVATDDRKPLRATLYVSIHATLAGGDRIWMLMLERLVVSIHATLAGGD